MAISFIQVNTQTLDADVSKIETDVEAIRQNMDKMFQSIQELESMWEGTAHNIFAQQFNVDYNFMKEVVDSVEKLATEMKEASKEYVKCEASINDEIKALNV